MERIRHGGLWYAAAAATLVLATAGLDAEVLDRIAAVVGNNAITVSEIDTELRLEALLNRTPLTAQLERRREVLTRLIDRRLILQDLALAPFLLVQPSEVELQLQQLRAQTYLGGRDLGAALRHYGLSERDCESFLEAQLGFERYVSFRFRTGLRAEPEAMEAYYREEYIRQQRARDAEPEPFEAVQDRIAQILVEQQTNELLDQRMKELRALHRIEILTTSLQERSP